ncbi:LiaF-related protein [Cytophagaceae bacterium ABcell3]|nr:LiaF-related protein [Cytophagaceae bacterium ABcell3]
MAILSSAMFWGILLILAGVSIILKLVFGINFPFFRVLFSLFLIYMGVRMLLGTSFKSTDQKERVVFSKTNVQYDRSNPEVNVVFGSGEIDYTQVEVEKGMPKGKVNVIFGNGNLYINENIPMRIQVTTVFGGSRFPDETVIAFGEYVYRTKAFEEGKPYLKVKADVVFGGCNIISEK